jgi:predicted RNase H-like HicB family nuclease
MHNEFTAVFERDGEWDVAYSSEIPGANGQGRTKEEAKQSLVQAIALILEDRREEGLTDIMPPLQVRVPEYCGDRVQGSSRSTIPTTRCPSAPTIDPR